MVKIYLHLLLVPVILLEPRTAGLTAKPQPLGHGGLPGLAAPTDPAVVTAGAVAGLCLNVRHGGLIPGEHLVNNQGLGTETSKARSTGVSCGQS